MPRLSLKIILSLIGVAILVAGFFIAVFLVQKQTNLKSKAYEESGSSQGNNEEQTATPDILSSELGFQIDSNDPTKIPSMSVFQVLHPKWVRFVYRERAEVPSCDPNIPNRRPDYGEACIPDNVKSLLVFNNESAEDAPIANTHFIFNGSPLLGQKYKDWKSYIDDKYIPELDYLLHRRLKINAIEVWNEPDSDCLQDYCPTLPPEAYAYMLKQAAITIKNYNNNPSNPSITVVAAGFGSGDVGYINKMEQSQSAVFDQVDVIGVHPYTMSPDSWCLRLKNGTLNGTCNRHELYQDLTQKIQSYINTTKKPVWVTEIGYGVIDTTEDRIWQLEFLKRSFKVLSNINIQVVIWYSWTDKMNGGVNDPGFGLVDDNTTIKPSGTQFLLFNK